MLRLGVVGGAENWIAVNRRLRGASVDPDAPPDACEAVLVHGGQGISIEGFLDAGKHVLLADEDVITAERLAAWFPLARQRGARLVIGNPDRHLPSRRLIKQQLDRHLGEPGLIRLHRWVKEPPSYLGRDLDVTLDFMGRPPDVVCAFQTEGLLQVHLGFPGGGMAMLGSAIGSIFADGYSSLSIIASAGAAHADDHANQQLLFSQGEARSIPTSESIQALTGMVQAFVDALAGGSDVPSETPSWLAVRDAVLESATNGRVVRLEGR